MKYFFYVLYFCALPSLAFSADILYIGDSHSVFQENNGSRMGSILVQGLSKNHNLVFIAACGSSPSTWVLGGETRCGYSEWSSAGVNRFLPQAPVPKFSDLLAQNKASTIIIEQGDNLFEWKKGADGVLESQWPSSTAEKSILRLLSEKDNLAPNALCIWIGPTLGGKGPTYRKTSAALDALYISLEKVVSSHCTIIDSRSMISSYIGGDGLHLNNLRSQEWANALVQAIEKQMSNK